MGLTPTIDYFPLCSWGKFTKRETVEQWIRNRSSSRPQLPLCVCSGSFWKYRGKRKKKKIRHHRMWTQSWVSEFGQQGQSVHVYLPSTDVPVSTLLLPVWCWRELTYGFLTVSTSVLAWAEIKNFEALQEGQAEKKADLRQLPWETPTKRLTWQDRATKLSWFYFDVENLVHVRETAWKLVWCKEVEIESSLWPKKKKAKSIKSFTLLGFTCALHQ